jgi:quercetin dioxygenase-like cupin family protein
MKFKLVKPMVMAYARLLAASITAGFLAAAGIAHADEARSGARDAKSVGITLMPVTAQVLPDDPKQTLTAFMVYLTPEARTTSHRHAGVVFVHVLEGTVRSQLNNGEVIEYRAGESWNEPPGSIHSYMENPSKIVPARLIATIIAPTGAKLTTYDQEGSTPPPHEH